MSRDCNRWKLYVLLSSNFSSATTSNEIFLDFAILAKCCTNHNKLCKVRKVVPYLINEHWAHLAVSVQVT